MLDTDGNGKRDAYVEPDQPVDPQKDKRLPGGFYTIMPSPVDGSVWAPAACSPARVPSCGSIPAQTRPRRRSPRSTTSHHLALHRAALTSTARASRGCHWAADISAASTGANARVR